MANRLQDRIAIVTGSSSGLGRAISLVYAANGARVVCADLQPVARDLLDGSTPTVATHEAIQEKYGKDAAIFIKCDVTDEESNKNLVSKAAEWGGRLDIMVCNAGIVTEVARGNALRIHETPVEDFDKTHAVNGRGVWLGNKWAVEQMLKQEPLPPNYRGDRTRGWIINTASILGLVAIGTSPCYVPIKHTVVGITRQVALDYAKDKIHCNALCPGFVNTAFIDTMLARDGVMQNIEALHPMGSIGKPEDIAGAAVFLASEEAAWMTGHPLVIDGGYTAQ